MGAETSSEQRIPVTTGPRLIHTEVKLIVYDLDGSAEIFVLNQLLRPLGTGIFHCGIQVMNEEWSFRGGRREGTGVFNCTPGTCANLHPREIVRLGSVLLPEGKVREILETMKVQWPSRGYDMLRRNCSHFCDEFCQHLGVGTLPQWVKNMAQTGAGLASMTSQVTGTINGILGGEDQPQRRASQYGPMMPPARIPPLANTAAPRHSGYLRRGQPPEMQHPRTLKESHVRVLGSSRSTPTLLTHRSSFQQQDLCRTFDGLQFDDDEVVQCCF